MARFSWASLEMLPNDIAPVAKRFTIAVAGSTSSIGMAAPALVPDTVVVVKCVLRRRSEVVVPGRFGPLLRLAAAFPGLVDLFYLPYRKEARS